MSYGRIRPTSPFSLLIKESTLDLEKKRMKTKLQPNTLLTLLDKREILPFAGRS